jgi:2-phospho-L-lactate guanylyltransferase (CobY/MobA/RfbA family)
MGDITNLKLKQLKHETDTLKRMLSFMQEENIHLKNRLSDVLREKFDNKMLDDVEVFQNNFVKEDMVINLLKNELAETENSLQCGIIIDDRINKDFDTKIKKLRLNIDAAERDFAKITSDFNNYLSENL